MASLAMVVLLAGAGPVTTNERSRPSPEELRWLVEGHAHAIEANHRELALSYVHPRSPSRPKLDTALRRQMSSYLEKARTSALEPIGDWSAGPMLALQVDQEFVRVFGMKFLHGTRRSEYRFREFGRSWRIWRIDELSSHF